MKYLVMSLLALTFWACQHDRPHTACRPHQDKKLENLLKLKGLKQYPESFLLNQRLIIKQGDNENSLTAHLLVEPSQARLVLTTDIGGSVLKLSSHHQHGSTIQKNLTSWGKDIILDGLLRDIEMIYGTPFLKGSQLGQRSNNDITLFQQSPSAHYELIYKKHSLHPYRLVAVWQGQIIYEITFKNHKKFEGWSEEIPSILEIKDYRKGYTATVITNTLELR